MDDVAVAPDPQGVGVGSRLLRLAEERAHARGLPEVRSYTNEAMVENLDYYHRRGYRETHRGTQDGYRRVFFTKPGRQQRRARGRPLTDRQSTDAVASPRMGCRSTGERPSRGRVTRRRVRSGR